MAKNIIIFGGHGKVALRAARELTSRGDSVTSVFRNPDHQAEVAETGATPLVLDIETADTDRLAETIAGHDAVVFSAGAGGGNPPRTYAVDRDAAIRTMDAAKQAGVNRYVMVSYSGASLDHGVPESEPFYHYAQSKAEADAYLRASGLDYTILGPGELTLEDPSGAIRQILPGEEPDENVSRGTSRGNVALAIVAALRHDASIGQTVNFYDGQTPIDDVFAS